jgi:hemolysin activation/secretion protein
MARILLLSAVLLWCCCAASFGQSPTPLGQELLPPPRGSGGAAQLPPVAPAAQPPAGVEAPTEKAPSQPLSTAPLFMLRGIKITGNTVLDQASIDRVVQPYIGQPASIATLDTLRRALTLLYIKRGYINSGFRIPDQNVTDGIIRFQAVEGRVTGVRVSGTRYFKPEYFESRLESGLTTPFNIETLEEEQQILLQDPLVQRLNIELLPGLAPGEAGVHADVVENHPYFLTAQIANDQSPTVGEVRGQLQGGVANILGVGDVLAAQYGRSSGINDGALAYSAPIAPDDTRLSIRYDVNGTLVVTPALSPLNVTSFYDSVALGLSRPFYRTPQATLTLGTSFEIRRAETYLLNMPFSFTPGADNGVTNVTVLRVYGEWTDRNADHALSLRSTVSFGLDALGATDIGTGAGSSFVSWLGQAEYVRRIYKDWEAVVRSDVQLTDHTLFPIEQFALGGIDSVRGYREYLTVTDDAFFASGELRIPIASLRIPRLADSDDAGKLQIVPFYDYGRGWNVDRPTPYPPDISGAGAGLRWDVGSGILAEFYYARPLRDVRVGTSLEDRGIYFRLTTKVF